MPDDSALSTPLPSQSVSTSADETLTNQIMAQLVSSGDTQSAALVTALDAFAAAITAKASL